MPHSQLDEDASATADGNPTTVTLVTDSLEKPSEDKRDYRVIRLYNELEALLVHDPDTDKASAALDVNVGNFSDEADIPGMAHAVEHLLLMGTKKFPIENEYQIYIKANAGSYNAFTEGTSTNYFFDISASPGNDQEPSDTNPSPLKGALDRFAQFFIEPLFLSETLDRELKAVDSENKKNLRKDEYKRIQLLKSLSNPKHPFSNFGTGNFEVLKTLPEARGINVRDKFIEFHGKHYSSNRMKLVVLGRESLDLLQKWVVELFSPVVNKKLPPNRWPDEIPFRDSELGMQCFAKPVMKFNELQLHFPFIDEESMCATQASRYISHLVGHKSPGSIMSFIKSKGWANDFVAGTDPVCPGTPGIFHMKVRLTEEGLEQYPEIIRIIFQYINLLRERQPQEWIFQEIKTMADADFRWMQKTPASKFTSKISSAMQKPYPREWLLGRHSLLREFAPDQIEQALSMIRPDNFHMILFSHTHSRTLDQKEKWYGTEYHREKIPKDLMEEFKKAAAVSPEERLSALRLPAKNRFIPGNLDVEKKEVNEPSLGPQVIRNGDTVRTWWKKDDRFWVPRANVMVILRTPLVHASAAHVVKINIFVLLVLDALEEGTYYAKLAGLQHHVKFDSCGLLLDVGGYNDKLLLLLEEVVATMRNMNISKNRFEITRKALENGYKNWELQSPYSQVGNYMDLLINAEPDFVADELLPELSCITLEEVKFFQQEVLGRSFIEMFVHGNMYKKDAIDAIDIAENILKPRVLPKAQWPILRSLTLPEGSNYVFKRTLEDPANTNHCVETWFYVGSRDDREVRTKTLLLGQMLHEPAFDQLRTKEQLGYIVFSGPRVFSTTYGFRFLIQSDMTPDFLDARVEAFLQRYADTLDKMSEREFEGHKRSLIVEKLEKLGNLDQESTLHWNQIKNGCYDFEQAQSDAARVKLLTKPEVAEFFNRHLNPTSKQRARLSIHLEAQGKAEGVDKRQEEAQKKADEEPSSGDAVKTAEEITDVRLHKARLTASSGAMPVKDISEYEDTDAKL